MFKKIFKWIGIILLSLIAIIVLISVYTGYKQGQYEETAIPYINEVIPIISRWNVEETRPLFSEEAIKDISDEDFEKMTRWLSKLGELELFDEPQFTNLFSGTSVKLGAYSIVSYSVNAKYKNGDAIINLRLIDQKDSFEIYKLNINSMALLDEGMFWSSRSGHIQFG